MGRFRVIVAIGFGLASLLGLAERWLLRQRWLQSPPGRQFEERLMGFNNLPQTHFSDVKDVLRIARERVARRLAASAPRSATR